MQQFFDNKIIFLSLLPLRRQPAKTLGMKKETAPEIKLALNARTKLKAALKTGQADRKES